MVAIATLGEAPAVSAARPAHLPRLARVEAGRWTEFTTVLDGEAGQDGGGVLRLRAADLGAALKLTRSEHEREATAGRRRAVFLDIEFHVASDVVTAFGNLRGDALADDVSKSTTRAPARISTVRYVGGRVPVCCVCSTTSGGWASRMASPSCPSPKTTRRKWCVSVHADGKERMPATIAMTRSRRWYRRGRIRGDDGVPDAHALPGGVPR